MRASVATGSDAPRAHADLGRAEDAFRSFLADAQRGKGGVRAPDLAHPDSPC
jgi:hypothetical protein